MTKKILSAAENKDKSKTTSASILSPCPFCGGKGVLIRNKDFMDYTVHCSSCNTETFFSDDKSEAVSDWQARCITNKSYTSMKPCPFCAVSHLQITFESGVFIAECQHCYMNTGYFNSPNELITHWNRRAAAAVIGVNNKPKLKGSYQFQKFK